MDEVPRGVCGMHSQDVGAGGQCVRYQYCGPQMGLGAWARVIGGVDWQGCSARRPNWEET